MRDAAIHLVILRAKEPLIEEPDFGEHLALEEPVGHRVGWTFGCVRPEAGIADAELVRRQSLDERGLISFTAPQCCNGTPGVVGSGPQGGLKR